MSREELLRWVADLARRNPDDAKGKGLFAVLLRMALRHEKSEKLLEDEEVVGVVSPQIFKPIIVKDLASELISWLGSGGQQDQKEIDEAGNQDREITTSDAYLTEQRRLPTALQTGYSMLYAWFTDEHEVIWRAAKETALQQGVARDSSAANYLKKSGKRWLKKRIDWDKAEAFLVELIRDAFNKWPGVFEGLGAKARDGSYAAYGLHGRGQSLKDGWDPLSFAKTLGRRVFKLHGERAGGTSHELEGEEDQQTKARRDSISIRLPYAKHLRDLLAEAMEKAGCGLTIDQARVVARTAFAIPHVGPHLPLPEDDPEHSGWHHPVAEHPTESQKPESQFAVAPGPSEQGPEITRAVQAIVDELLSRDGVAPDERPSDSKQGREARYLLDFEIWNGFGLLPGPETDLLLAKVRAGSTGHHRDYFTQVIFEAWSGASNAAVSEWRVGRRKNKSGSDAVPPARRITLLARGATVFYGWATEQAIEEISKGSRRAADFVRRLFFALRIRFFHRKPEFVSAGAFGTNKNENE